MRKDNVFLKIEKLNSFFLKDYQKISIDRFITDINEIGKDILIENNGEILYKYDHLKEWKKFKMNFEDDLLVIGKKISDKIIFNKDTRKFDWAFCIGCNNSELENIFQKGFANNHYHLWGSLNIFKQTWVSLVNNPVKMTHYKNKEGYEEIIRLIIKASLIRVNIYCDMKSIKLEDVFLKYQNISFEELYNSIDKIQNFIDVLKNGRSDYVQYHEDLNIENEYASERKLIYDSIVHTLKYNKDWILIKEYIRCKESVRRLVMRNEDEEELRDFYELNQNKNKLIRIFDDYDKLVYPTIIREIENQNIKNLEIRIKPKNTEEETLNYIKRLENAIDPKQKYTQVFKYLISFSRSENDTKLMKKQVKAIESIIENNQYLANRLVGIDVCSREKIMKVENIAKILVENKSFKSINKTYHIGEEFVDILSGLRAIDECIDFLDFKNGDRLGHAIPLWFNIKEWYKKNPIIEIRKHDYMDNMMWILINKEVLKESEYKSIKDDFYNCFKEIYPKEYYSKLKYDIYDYYEAWRLRHHDKGFIKKELAKMTFENVKYKQYYLVNKYFTEYEKLVDKSEFIKYTICPNRIEAIKRLQKKLQQKIRRLGIGVEICPSTYMFDKENKTVFYKSCEEIYSEYLNKSELIKLTINTDNEGILGTNIKEEFLILANHLEECGNSDKEKVYNFIEYLRKNGFELKF